MVQKMCVIRPKLGSLDTPGDTNSTCVVIVKEVVFVVYLQVQFNV